MLGEGNVKEGRGPLHEESVFSRLRHADDFEPRTAGIAQPDPLANRILLRPVLLGRCLIHYSHQARIGIIGRSEAPSFYNRHTKGSEVVLIYAGSHDVETPLTFRHLV